MVARLKPCDYFYEENVEIRYRRVGYREFVVAGPAPLALVVEVPAPQCRVGYREFVVVGPAPLALVVEVPAPKWRRT